MKNILISIALILPLFSFSTILTVDNSNNSPGQYTSFSSAHNVAVAGDTILVKGSLLSYGNATITKKIILIGSGYNPSPTNVFPTVFNNITIMRNSSSNASNTEIYGIKVKSSGFIEIWGSSSSGYISNVTVERCFAKIKTKRASAIKITNNIISRLVIEEGTTSGSKVNNNIILSIYFSNYFNTNSLTFDHNIFTNGANTFFRYCIVKNSIFFNFSPNHPSTIHTTFSNNMAYGSANDTFNITTNANTGFNNLNHTNPNFVSAASTFNYNNDYHLQAGSQGIGAAIDGTNLGIYGGLYPFPIGGASGSGFQTSQEPAIPQIYEYIIHNQTIQPSDSVSVNIKVSIQK